MRHRSVALLLSLCAAGATSAADVVVTQKDKQFSASAVRLKPGDRLVFKNDDPVNHNVFSLTPGMDFNLKSQAPGTESSVTLDKEGTSEVRCAFHPSMKLTVVVKR